MKRGQRILALLLSVLLSAVLFLHASASVRMPIIDGNPRNKWHAARQATLFTSAANSGNSLTFCVFYFIPDFRNNRFAFAFRAAGPDCTAGSLAGIRLKVDSFGSLQFTLKDPENPIYDGELTHVQSAMVDWSIHGGGNEFSAEAMVDLKRSVPEKLVLTIQILDSIGEPSKPVSFTVENEFAIIPPTEPPLLTDPYATTTRAAKKTTPTTTKASKPKATASSAKPKATTAAIPKGNPAWTNAPATSATYYYPPQPALPSEQYDGNTNEEDTYTIQHEQTAVLGDGAYANQNNVSGNNTLRTAAIAAGFLLLVAAAAVGVLRKPREDAS